MSFVSFVGRIQIIVLFVDDDFCQVVRFREIE